MPDLKQTISNTDLYAVTQQWFLKLDFLLLVLIILVLLAALLDTIFLFRY